ncbi:MAG TPA: glycoside hydrolase family 16 protein [Draconibacterium sp.]|nr:glycoside hydrolase family 16 protein [Draconibacterium sp.]
MNTKWRNKIWALIIFLKSFNIVSSQIPSEDPRHYILETEDNFNSFNSALWNSTPNNTWGLETYNANNVTTSNNTLTLKCERIINGNDTSYISGGIGTVNKKLFSYGYYEILTQMPTKSKGYWGGFWMHSGGGQCIKGIDPGCYDVNTDTITRIWYEIDIFEPNGNNSLDGNKFNFGSHNTISECCTDANGTELTLPIDFSASFNKLALIWEPNKVKVLVNGVEKYIIDDSKYVPTEPMALFLTFQIDAAGGKPTPSTLFPAYWKYKNFKYYRLKTDCLNGITQSNFDFVNHDYKVQKYYSLTNSTVPSNQNIILRATDYIKLNGEFTVPLGSTLKLITHCNTCPD